MTPLTSPTRAAAGVPIAELAEALGGTISGAVGAAVRGVQQDSRRVAEGDLFVALSGARVDGIRFAPAAVERGAVAVLCARGRAAELAGVGVAAIEVDDPRRAMARAAALVYGRPTEALSVIGITGTNGKTTTAHLVEAALLPSGARVGVVGTLGHRLGATPLGEGHTSPEADELQRIVARMRADGASHLVMEVSSIALAAERVAEVHFAVAAFTNLTQDHLDYHGSMQAYAAAKDRLFLDHRPPISVVNVDDPHGAELARRLPGGCLRYSTEVRSDAEVRPRAVSCASDGIAITLHPSGVVVRSPLVGDHNVSNILCAVGVARALGLDDETTARGIAAMNGVAGRLERCDDPALDEVVALVDYAHTPDALARVLASVRPLVRGRLWCIFGCGGDRDPDKRGPMGEAVARAADEAIVTNDNPRGERPEEIAKAVVRGLERAGAAGRYRVELDRRRAIELAVREATPGDVLLVAGKGHEPYQIIDNRVLAFDDREELRAALARRREGRR